MSVYDQRYGAGMKNSPPDNEASEVNQYWKRGFSLDKTVVTVPVAGDVRDVSAILIDVGRSGYRNPQEELRSNLQHQHSELAWPPAGRVPVIPEAVDLEAVVATPFATWPLQPPS